MKKDFNKIIKTIDMEDFEVMKKDKDGKKEEVKLTFKDRIINSLLGFHEQKDANMTGKQKVDLFNLAKKVNDAEGEEDFTVEEFKMIKDRCAIFMPILFYGQLEELIESDAESN